MHTATTRRNRKYKKGLDDISKNNKKAKQQDNECAQRQQEKETNTGKG
jgi:hypothetical protein